MFYIAIVCPEPVNEVVLSSKNWMRQHFGSKAALKSPAHITLIPPFLMEERLIDTLTETLSLFSFDTPSIDLQVRNFNHFTKRVIYAQVEEQPILTDLKTALEKYLVQQPALGIRQELRSFHAHITVAARDLKEDDFAAAWEHFSTQQYEADFSATAFSLLQLKGPKWEVLETFEW